MLFQMFIYAETHLQHSSVTSRPNINILYILLLHKNQQWLLRKCLFVKFNKFGGRGSLNIMLQFGSSMIEMMLKSPLCLKTCWWGLQFDIVIFSKIKMTSHIYWQLMLTSDSVPTTYQRWWIWWWETPVSGPYVGELDPWGLDHLSGTRYSTMQLVIGFWRWRSIIIVITLWKSTFFYYIGYNN